MDGRKPLWQHSTEELRALLAEGCSEQERRTVETLLVNRALQVLSPGAFARKP